MLRLNLKAWDSPHRAWEQQTKFTLWATCRVVSLNRAENYRRPHSGNSCVLATAQPRLAVMHLDIVCFPVLIHWAVPLP